MFSVCLTILTVTLSYSPVFTSSVKAYAGNNGIYSYTLGRNISYSALIDFEYNTVSIDMQSTQGFLDSNDVIMVPYDIVYGTNGANFTLARDTEKNTVTISDGKNTLKMTIGKTKARLNGHIYYLDAAPQIVMYKKSIKKDWLFLPVQFQSIWPLL